MRNLKKYLSVLLVVVMIASTMVPAFAAETYSYSDQAQKLNTLGLYSGISATTFDPDLGTALDRETGIVMLLRIFGLEATAKAMSDADAAAALAAFTDAKDVSEWALKSVAYAVKNGLVAGTSATTVSPKVALSGEMYATLILRQLGYTVTVNDFNNATYLLADKGGLKITEAIIFDNKNLIKDDLVGITFGALNAQYSNGTTVLADLMADGVVTVANAVYAGVYTAPATPTPTVTPTPAAAKVESVATNNLKSFVVTFNKAIDDTTFTFGVNNAAAGDNVRLYSGSNLVNIAAKEVASDKKSVTLYVTNNLSQDTTYKLTLTAVKTAAPVETIAGDTSFTVRDVTSPALSSVALTSPTTMVLTFSEPMNLNLPISQVWSTITIDGVNAVGTLSSTTNLYKLTFTPNTALTIGDHAVTVSSSLGKDFAGFTFAAFSGTLTLAADSAAPAVSSVTVVNKDKVEVVFDENITNISNTTFTIDNIAWNATASGAKATLTSAGTSLSASALSASTLKYTAVKDNYGNSTGTTAVSYSFTAPLDNVKPAPVVTLNSDNTYTVEFAEDVVTTPNPAADSALTLANYKLYDKDGVYKSDATGIAPDATYSTKKFKISFTGAPNLSSINAAQYTLKINNIKDMSIVSNLMLESVTTLTVNDTKAPTASAPVLTAANTIKLVFDEAMDAATLALKDNYIVNIGAGDKYLSAITDSSVSVASDNKSVTLTIPGVLYVPAPGVPHTVKLLAIKDASGKLLTNLNAALAVDTTNAFAVAADVSVGDGYVKLIALNQIKIKLDSASANTFDSASAGAANNWKIGTTTGGADAGNLAIYVTSVSVASDGKSVTLTLSENVKANAVKTINAVDYNIAVYTNGAVVKDTFGQVLDGATGIVLAAAVVAVDAVAPTATIATGDATGEIKITFNENITDGTISLYNNTTGAVVAITSASDLSGTIADADGVDGNVTKVSVAPDAKAFKITGLTSGNSYTVTLSGITDGATPVNTAAASQATVNAK